MTMSNTYAPEIVVRTKNYIPKKAPSPKTLHLKAWSCETPKSNSYSHRKLSSDEQSGCDMATD